MVGDAHGVQRALQRLGPVVEKAAQLGKLRGEVVILPDIDLQQARVIWKTIVDFGCGQAVAFHLHPEFTTDDRWHMSLLCRFMREDDGDALRIRIRHRPPRCRRDQDAAAHP